MELYSIESEQFLGMFQSGSVSVDGESAVEHWPWEGHR